MNVKRKKLCQCGNKQESRTVSSIQSWREVNDSLSDDEFEALAICVGERAPDEERTRTWAWKKLKPIMQSKLSGLMAVQVIAASQLKDVDPRSWEYILPKEKQVLETTGPDGGPQEMNVTHRIEDYQFEATMQAYRAIRQKESEQDEPIDA